MRRVAPDPNEKVNTQLNRILVVSHATQRLLSRRPGDLPRKRENESIEKYIEREVANGIKRGRVARRKPKVFRLYGDSRGLMSNPDDHCVWNEDLSLAWIVRRTGVTEVVMTTLTRARS